MVAMDRKVFEAAASGEESLIQGLEEQRVDSQQVTPQKNTILHIVVRFNQKGITKDVVRLCPTLLHKTNADGDSPLHVAAKIGSKEMVGLLIGGTMDIESQQLDHIRMQNLKEKDTALHVAVKYGHFDVAELLMGKDEGLLDMVNAAQESPLFLAVEGGFFNIAQHILKHFRSDQCSGPKEMNALHAAVIRTHHAHQHDYRTPDLSLENIRRQLRGFLLHADQCIPTRNNGQPTQMDIIHLLLQKGRGLAEKMDSFGCTPLHCAAHLGHHEATELLLRSGPNCVAYLQDKEGMSALHIAAKGGHVHVMKEIIRQNPDACDIVDSRGWTPLHAAVANNKLNVVSYILETPMLENLINAADNRGNTPLHLAAGRDKYSIMKILVDDTRVHKMAQNHESQKAIDLIQTNPNIGELYKSIIAKKLENQGGRPSLQALVHKGIYGRATLMDRLLSRVGSRRETDTGEDMKSHRLKNISSIHLLVATLIATVTFTAGFTMPGGFQQGGALNEGLALLSSKTPFKMFVIADSIAFYCASASVFLQFCGSVEHNYHLLLRFTKVAAALTYLSSLGMVVAFSAAMYTVMPGSSMLAYYTLISGICCVLVYIFGFL
ncbi:hypothetical protein FNV43_RR25068 [Rhamnella rubrinervis]|uniref:PGG domain-containing protein n=1 Tax=Rhamnella rubrinervis TaxID=2594499 RepID=A0A8K0DUD7_9ROSA|nr:hypothetical protein FNV43_RR25068 [Rhamnella rubrinervis]